jgi:GTP-binding protein HflX
LRHNQRGQLEPQGRLKAGPVDSGSAGAERAIVLLPSLRAKTGGEPVKPPRRDAEARRQEAIGLVEAIGVSVAGAVDIPLRNAVPATLIGTGKIDEIAALVRINEAGLVIIDHPLTPVQQRNLENAWSAKVLDRTALILEIFGERAQTKEGRLQVELAHLNYQKSRLVRSWTHLERQRGGFGFLGGPGETQIEADRRQIQARIKKIEKALAGVRNMRQVHRAKRKRVPQPVVALVGYTNAGKSTLFNHLTGEGVLAKDMLFATLDPTLRRVPLPHGEEIILSDTVGFISDLPTTLVAAFHATLEEVVEADVILHVRDITSPQTDAEAHDVYNVLGELGLEPVADKRIIEVWNKIDQLKDTGHKSLLARAARSAPEAIPVSAITGEGIEPLLVAVEKKVMDSRPSMRVTLGADDLSGLPWLYENLEVLERTDSVEDGSIAMLVRVPEKNRDALTRWAREAGIKLSRAGRA